LGRKIKRKDLHGFSRDRGIRRERVEELTKNFGFLAIWGFGS